MRISKIYKGYIIAELIISLINLLFVVLNLSSVGIEKESVMFSMVTSAILLILITLVIIYSINKKDKLGFKVLFVLGVVLLLFTVLQIFNTTNIDYSNVDYFYLINIIFNLTCFILLIKEFNSEEVKDEWHIDSILILIIGIILILSNLYSIITINKENTELNVSIEQNDNQIIQEENIDTDIKRIIK